MFIVTGIYIVGVIVSFLFLNKFGLKIGLEDYDEPKTYATMDSWDSNTEAWFAFSLIWPVFYGILSIIFLFRLLFLLVKKLNKIING